MINSWAKGKWYIQGVVGTEITRYFNDLSTDGLDIRISPEGKVLSPLIYGYYATYEHNWTDDIFSNFTYGLVHLENFSFTEENAFREGYTLRADTFWNITEGAKLGGEIIWGKRIDKNNSDGNAFRMNLLFYYDF